MGGENIMIKKDQKQRLKEIFESTIDSDLKFKGKLENINYYNILCEAVSKDNFFKFRNNNLCMFNYNYKNEDSILMIFSIPINQEIGIKNIAERVMEILNDLEQTFITLDYIKSEEIKEDKFVYITAIKKIEEKV